MVFRYWGDAHAGVEQFGTLVERRAGGAAGIAADVLLRAVAARGWRTERTDPSLEGLRRRLDDRQPVIVLVADRRDSYHYIVVVGMDDNAVVVHDPSWGPYRRISQSLFETLWRASQYWSLVVLPGSSLGQQVQPESDPGPQAQPASGADHDSACDALLDAAISAVAERGLEHAEELVAPVRERCPESAGPYREMAGVRFAQKRFAEAASLARDAVARAPNDSYANDVLGSSLFMLDDPEGALRAWNRAGKPRLDVVQIEGVRHTRYQAVTEALGLKPETLLTADAFAQAKRRLDEWPDRSVSRLSIRPQPDGFASVDVAIAERAGRPRGAAEWIGTGVRAGVDREVRVVLPGFTGQGEIWTASWRWYQNRPRAAVGFAAPRFNGLFGVWRVEGSWEAETYAFGDTVRRDVHKHGGLSVSDWVGGNIRYAVNAGFDDWEGGRRAASIGGSLEHRWLADRFAVAGNLATWMPVDGGRGFSAAGMRAATRSPSNWRAWAYEATIGIDRVTHAAPLALWPGAGEGRARPVLLRAHPLLDDGIIDMSRASAFGRSLQHANVEAQRWLARPGNPRLAVAAFADVARSARRADGTMSSYVDIGSGLRVRLPGVDQPLRIDVARGLRDGASAVTVGLSY